MTNIPSSQSVCPIYLCMVIQPLLLLTIITFYAYLHNPSSLILRQYSIKIVSESWNEKICSTENICSTEKNFFSVSFLENDRKLQKRSPAKRKFVHLKLYSSSSTYQLKVVQFFKAYMPHVLAYLLYSTISGNQMRSQGILMRVMPPKSAGFHVSNSSSHS